MLDLMLGLMLAGADLNDPGIGSPGLDSRNGARPAISVDAQLAGTGSPPPDLAEGRVRTLPERPPGR